MRRFIKKKRFLSGISVRCMWVDERVAHAIPFFCEPTSFPLSVLYIYCCCLWQIVGLSI